MTDTYPVTLDTDRLVLRGWRDDDLDDYAAMFAEPEIVRWTGRDGPAPSRALAWRHMASMIGHWHLRGYSMFAVEERATGRLVGRVGPWCPEGWPGIEIGWALAASARGEGYATEAAHRAMQWTFDTHAPARLVSMIRQGNMNSVRVAERLGERRLEDIDIGGETVWLYGVERDAFR